MRFQEIRGDLKGTGLKLESMIVTIAIGSYACVLWKSRDGNVIMDYTTWNFDITQISEGKYLRKLILDNFDHNMTVV